MPTKTDHQVVITVEQLNEVCQGLAQADTIACDLETSSFDAKTGYIVGIGLSVREAQAWYIPIGHSIGDQLPTDVVLDALQPYLEDGSKTYVFHNAKFDTRWLHAYEINIPYDRIEDTMLEIFVAAEGHQHFNLKDLTWAIFKHKMVKFEELFPRGVKEKNIGHLRIDIVAPYACEDVDYTRRHHIRIFDRVRTSFIYKLERQLWPIVQQIEDTGFGADAGFLTATAQHVAAEAEKVKTIIYQQASQAIGHRVEFKISSPKELSEVLYGMMRIPIRVRTPTGQPATSEIAFDKLKADYPICANILTYRSMVSNARTMSDTLTAFIQQDGHIHTQYNQAGATTGRFASSDPNMQNQAKLKTWKIIRSDGSTYTVIVLPRDAFIAGPDQWLLELDYKQIEFICMAAEAGEESVLRAYENGEDLHRHTAALIFNKPQEEVTKEERDKSKVYNYLVIYGGSAHGLSLRSDLSEEEADDDIRQLFRKYPRFLSYMQRVRDKARVTRKVVTHFGRWQVVPEYFESGRRAQGKAERACVNRIIQGTAADIHKMGLIRTLKRSLKSWTWEQVHMCAQTHDSQTWENHKSIMPWDLAPMLAEAMSPEVPNYPRIQVDAKIGISWGTMYDYDFEHNKVKVGDDWIDLDEQTFHQLLDRWCSERQVRIDNMGSVTQTEIQAWVEQAVMDIDEPRHHLLVVVKSLTREQSEALKSIVHEHPGDNTITVHMNGQSKTLSTGTSLRPDVLGQMLTPILPGCRVSVGT